MSFRGKTVVITGASSGIGAASCIEFARRGASLALIARRREKLEELEKTLAKFGIDTLVCECDVSDKEQVQKMSLRVIEKFGKIDVLVNNAGFAIYGAVSDLTVEEIESQMKTNYFGMVYCTKNFLPKMLEQKFGHICNRWRSGSRLIASE